MNRLTILNYGMGNLRSVVNAFESFGCHVEISSNPAKLRNADRIVLPGVGAFIDGMTNLRNRGWIEPLRREVMEHRKPFLGICLGMQLLATTGTEGGEHPGIGFIPGVVTRLEVNQPGLRVPHIGWNDVRHRQTTAMYAGLGDMQAYYFVHSYVLRPDDPGVVNGVCSHGGEFAASLEAGNIWATQFHPEKSQKAGLALLRNFAEADVELFAPAAEHPVSVL